MPDGAQGDLPLSRFAATGILAITLVRSVALGGLRNVPFTAGRIMCLGIPGRVVEIRDDAGLLSGVVDFGGVRREVCLEYVAEQVSLGDYVIVHVGFAISKVDEAEALRTFEVLREMSQLDELEWIADVLEPVPPAPAGASTNTTPTRGLVS